jgi:hypothetical protein
MEDLNSLETKVKTEDVLQLEFLKLNNYTLDEVANSKKLTAEMKKYIKEKQKEEVVKEQPKPKKETPTVIPTITFKITDILGNLDMEFNSKVDKEIVIDFSCGNGVHFINYGYFEATKGQKIEWIIKDELSEIWKSTSDVSESNFAGTQQTINLSGKYTLIITVK